MRIAIDISPIIYETGVSVYTQELVRNLLLIDRDNQYILFGGSLRRLRELRARSLEFKGNYQSRLFVFPPTAANIVWNIAHVLPVETLIGKLDVFHSSDWTQPPSKAFKVTTIHDLTPIKYPRLSHPTIVATHSKRFFWVKKEADAVIVPSTATKKDLVDLDFKEEKIFVIPEALPPAIKKVGVETVKEVKNRYRISGKYLLSIGVTPRKNIDRIISAFERVRAGEDLKLVVVGEAKMRVEPARGVIYTGHIAFHELSALYTGAEALVYPSLYEGFGLPILEAFACGTAVVTSNASSMREVAGGAAILVDPYRIESISEGIKTALLQKKELGKLGRQRVREFSWEKTARMTLDVYKRALK